MLPKPMMKEELSFDDLPEDVILKILCRLPVKYLIRFSCVSKRWRGIIIFDSQFGNAHLKLASGLGTISRGLLLFQRPARKPMIIDIPKQSLRLQSSDIGDNSLERFPTIPSKEKFRNIVAVQSIANLFRDDSLVRNLNFPCNVNITKVMASCNGLLLLRTNHKDFSVWNPSTGFFRKITAVPDFPAIIATEWRIVTAHYGFGYVSSADDYKLVLVETWTTQVSRDVNMFVFSMRVNSWKVIKVSGWRGERQCGSLVNEAIHWVYYRTGKDDTFQIYAFDLANEEFRQLPGPQFNQDDNRNNHTCYSIVQTVVHLGGCLCILFQPHWDFVKVDIELWMMRDYGVSDSWMKLYKLRLNDIPDVFHINIDNDWLPIFVEEDGTLVIKLITKKELVRIECRQGEKPVCRDRYRLIEELPGCEFLFDVTLYDETLLSVTQ